MKTRLLYIVPFLAVLIAGCTKTPAVTPVTLPTGNFTGQFLRIHQDPTTSKLDTLKANLNLALSATTGFQVTGDTTIHAGSYGSYGANSSYLEFIDATYSMQHPGTKYHLEGYYAYTYDGTNLNFYVTYSDTLSLQYAFKKSAN